MNYHINKPGDLLITVSRQEQSKIRADKGKADFQSDAYMIDLFKTLTSNSELEWIRPEEIGALTDAPILGIVEYSEYTKTVSEKNRFWWYPNYQVRSPQEDLLRDGECVFQKAEVVE